MLQFGNTNSRLHARAEVVVGCSDPDLIGLSLVDFEAAIHLDPPSGLLCALRGQSLVSAGFRASLDSVAVAWFCSV
jgi:hypothetical protein